MYFYVLINFLFLFYAFVLFKRTSTESYHFKQFKIIESKQLLKPLCMENAKLFTFHAFIVFIKIAYLIWCNIMLLDAFNIFRLDTVVGIFIIFIVVLVEFFKRVLILQVGKKSVLYLHNSGS